MVRQDRQDPKDLLAQSGSLDHLETKVHQVCREELDQLVNKEIKDHLDHLGHLEILDRQELLDQLDLQDPLDHLDCQDHQAVQGRLGALAQLDRLAPWDNPVKMDPLDLPVLQARMVRRVT